MQSYAAKVSVNDHYAPNEIRGFPLQFARRILVR